MAVAVVMSVAMVMVMVMVTSGFGTGVEQGKYSQDDNPDSADHDEVMEVGCEIFFHPHRSIKVDENAAPDRGE